MSEMELYLDEIRTSHLSHLDVSICGVLFSEAEFYSRPPAKSHARVRTALKEYYHEDDSPTAYQYVYSSAGVVRERLAIQGYTTARVARMWEEARQALIGTLTGFRGDTFAELISVFSKITYEEWQRALESKALTMFEGGEAPYPGIDLQAVFREEPLWDGLASLAIELDALRPISVWVDLTMAYPQHGFAPTASLHQNLNDSQEPYDPALGDFDRIVILTEGKTDQRIVSGAMTALYPEFANAYQFMDFEAFRIEGGASPLARMVKAFAGVRIQSRMLAIFDNDAAGAEAMMTLRAIKLPSNLRTMCLPDLEFARLYPTVGPEGLRRMDVNGRACAIEMFLGRRSLTDEDGNLRPVRWSQWNKVAARYQGEVDGKDAATAAFLRDLNGTPRVLRRRFPEMCLLLQAIFDAFKD